jgi:ATP-binding cassette subfamily B protein
VQIAGLLVRSQNGRSVVPGPITDSRLSRGGVVEREVERKAFARAWSYLNYNATAKWSALLAAVGIGVLSVALLVLLWLFADLMVHGGNIPSVRDLSVAQQQRFQAFWHGLSDEDKATDLEEVGVPKGAGAKLAADAAENFAALAPEQQSLVWRSYLSHMLRERVGGVAGALVLPTFRELPAEQQEEFAQRWAALPDKSTLLSELQFPPEAINELTNGDVRKLPPARKEQAWRAALYQTLRDRTSRTDLDEATYLQRRLSAEAESDTLPEVPVETDPLADHGLLSLLVRSEIQHNLLSPEASAWARGNPYRAFTPVLGLIAYTNPWMWKYGGGAGQPTFFYYLTGLALLAIILVLLLGVLAFLLQVLAARASIEATTRLRRAVYHHTFRLGTLAFRALGPGEAVSIFTRHVEAVHDALYTWITVLFVQPIKFALLLAFALIIHPLLALAFLLFALLVWLVGGQVASYVRSQSRAATTRAAEQLTLIRESLMLMRLVKCYLMELFNQSRVERQLARHAAAQLRRYRGEALYRPLLGFLGMLAAVCLLYVGGLIVLHGQLSVASAIAMATALICLYGPVQAWLENRKVLRRGRESAAVLFRFLDRPGEVGQVVGAEFLTPLGKELEFDNVSLREPGSNRMLLQDVSLTIKAGERIGLIGSEDLEKYALVYLIPRFLDPTSGEIRIDQHNLRWVTLDSLRAQIALVMQHHLVFHDTVANNIGCGDPAYTLPQIIEAAKMAHAHHFIQKLPKGYETAIGELGHTLSMSEQFRIALARAILRDPALIIIEEPETPLDDDSKSLLDDTFARVLPGRTAIFLPHRISTIRSCDRIFLLHKGRLEATGDHRGLLSQNSLYRHLHYLEFNEIVEQV